MTLRDKGNLPFRVQHLLGLRKVSGQIRKPQRLQQVAMNPEKILLRRGIDDDEDEDDEEEE